MRIAMIVAADEQGVIGFQGNIPWHLPEDLKKFKERTMGHPVIVGRKTFESIGRPLPGRTNIVITNIQDYHADGCLIAHSLDDALGLAKDADEVFVIGGGQIFKLALPVAEVIYFTKVHTVVDGDVFSPGFNKEEWELVSSEFHKKNEKNPVDFTYLTYKRNAVE